MTDFYIVAPIDIGSASIASNNAPHTETLWTAGTYTLGTIRRFGDYVYEVVADPSTTDQPDVGAAANPATWIVVDVVNPLRMFDDYIANATTGTGSIEFTTVPLDMPTAIALFGLVGETLDIEVTSGGNVVFSETITLQDWSAITDWYQFFFSPVIGLDKVVRLNIPPYSDAVIHITVSGAAVQIGECVIGSAVRLGQTLQGTEIGVGSYSTRYEDTFGIVRVIERDTYELANYNVYVDRADANYVKQQLFSRESKPTIFVGDSEAPELIVYGFYEDMRLAADHLTAWNLKLDVVGLT